MFSWLQSGFTGTALGAFIVLLGGLATLGYNWYSAAVNEMRSATATTPTDQQRDRTRQVKDLLGNSITSGTVLMADVPTKDKDTAKTEAETWATRAREIIASAYGEGEAALFLDS